MGPKFKITLYEVLESQTYFYSQPLQLAVTIGD